MMELSPNDPTLGLFQVLREDGTSDPENDPFLPSEMLLRMFRELLRIRTIDERMLVRQRQGKIGFYGTITGQEAPPIATALALHADDWIFPALRESACMLVRGFPLDRWLAQVYGNEADVLKGRQMPSHMSGKSVNQVSWSSCIGPQIPQAVGAAYAMKLEKSSHVALAFLGDGATSQPDFHAAMNFAGVWKVPCVIVCQNNGWSISVPTAKQTRSETLAVKAHAYGVRGVRIDGNDVLAVYRTVREAADLARSGGGTTFIECVTYRIGAHSSSDDPTRYRSNEEVEQWKKKDPLLRFERYLRRADLLDDAQRAAMEREIQEEISAAIAKVEPLPAPARETMFDDVYRTLPNHLEDERAELIASPRAPGAHGGH